MDALSREDIREVGDYQSKQDLSLPEEEERIRSWSSGPMAFRPNAGSISRSWAFLFGTVLVPASVLLPAKSSFMPKGYDIVIFGDREHPEVIGLLGYADGRGPRDRK